MQTRKIRVLLEPTDDIIQLRAPGEDQPFFQLIAGQVQIDMNEGAVNTVHAAFAATLGLACRPRTYEEMMAGHTREALDLLQREREAVEVWTLTLEYPQDDDIFTSVHPTEQAAWDAVRALNEAKGHDDLDNEDLRDALQDGEHEVYVQVESHSLMPA